MPEERIICCCGASTWTKVIAWLQIVGNMIMTGLHVWGVAVLASTSHEVFQKNLTIAVLAVALVIAIVGFIMGIILLNGTNQKRIGFLRAWLIYAGLAILNSIVSLIVIISTSDRLNGQTLGSGIVGIAGNTFCFAVVFIHMKEIREDVV